MALPGKINPCGNNKDWHLCLINNNNPASREKITTHFPSEPHQQVTKWQFCVFDPLENDQQVFCLEGGLGEGEVKRQTAVRTCSRF